MAHSQDCFTTRVCAPPNELAGACRPSRVLSWRRSPPFGRSSAPRDAAGRGLPISLSSLFLSLSLSVAQTRKLTRECSFQSSLLVCWSACLLVVGAWCRSLSQVAHVYLCRLGIPMDTCPSRMCVQLHKWPDVSRMSSRVRSSTGPVKVATACHWSYITVHYLSIKYDVLRCRISWHTHPCLSALQCPDTSLW